MLQSRLMVDFGPLSQSLLDQIDEAVQKEERKKGERLVRQGDVASTLYFLVKGSCRCYTLKDGKDITNWFAFDQEFITPFTSFFPQKPSYESIELLEDAQLIRFDHRRFQSLRQGNPEFEKLVNHFITQYTIQLEERLLIMQTYTAKEKHQYLLQQFPQLVQRIPVKHLASFLGISRETLSRMRAAP